MRYRVVESKGKHYKIEYQENGGGTLTTSATVEFDIEQRNIRRDGSPTTIRVGSGVVLQREINETCSAAAREE